MSELLGYSVSMYGNMLKTVNGGVSWTLDYGGGGLGYLEKTDNNILYAVGEGGLIIKNDSNYGSVSPSCEGLGTAVPQKGLSNDKGWSLYPNPVSHSSTLAFENPKNESCTFTLFDCEGRMVNRIAGITGSTVEIEKNNLATGLYFFQLRSDSRVIAVWKFIVG